MLHAHARSIPGKQQDPTADLNFKIAQAEKAGDFTTWAHVFARVWNKWNVPAQQLYELVRRCPAVFTDSATDLRLELLGRYRDELLGTLRDDNITTKIWKFITLLQLANFINRTAYLEARALTLAAFREVMMPLPKEIKERIATCDKWNAKMGRYTEAELLAAGFVVKKEDAHQKILFHPLSHESLTIHAKDNLSCEEKAKVRALKDSARHARRAERSKNPNKGASAAKEKGGKKK